MDKNQTQENKMGVMPVGRLLVNMSVPMMASMLVMALYNIVDSMFVARVSENALTALSMAFPVQNLMVALAAGLGVGLNAVLSRALGAKDERSVSKAASNGLFLMLLCAAAFMLLGATCSRLYFEAQTDIAEIVEGGVMYTGIVTVGCLGLFMQILFERLLQSTGRTVLTMYSQLVGTVINIVLDPILIFGLLGMPRMGVAGAALATILGQWISAAVGLTMCLRKNPEVKLTLKRFRPEGAMLRRILSIGVPSVIMQSIGSVMVFGMNQILIAFTATATAVFGVYFKLQSFIFMPVFGLNNGVVPIVAYNYGARKPDRIVKTIKLSVMYAMGIMFLGFLAFQLAPDLFLSMFLAEGETSGDLLSIGVPALRTISISFLFAGFCIVCSSVFQALGHGVLSLVVSVVRQLMVLLPVAFLLSRIGGLAVVWWAFPIAELFSVGLSALFLRRVYRKEIHPLEM